MAKPILVYKIGSSSLTDDNGNLQQDVLTELSAELSELQDVYNIIIVSSGAVGTGRHLMKSYSNKKIKDRKAAAAIGNPILIAKYSEAFSRFSIPIAQTLLERSHFSNRNQFLQFRDTVETLWKNGIIPIANENDVVSDLELRFSDNDELATLIAIGLDASYLIFSTAVEGLLDGENKLVKEVAKVDVNILRMASGETSTFGLGGMISKLTFAQLATRMGIEVFILGSKTKNGIGKALKGETGTRFLAQEQNLSSRKKWLASGSMVTGRIAVDDGAKTALKKRNSLLSVGVTKVVSDFNEGEVVEIVDGNSVRLAVARIKISAELLRGQLGNKNIEVAHADDIVIL